MTREEFRMMLMKNKGVDGFIDSFIEALVRLMMEFKQIDPRVILDMPSTTFDILTETYVSIGKKDKKRIKNKGKTRTLGR